MPRTAQALAWERDRRLEDLGYSSYDEYIQSAAWYAVRRRYRASDLPQNCQLCGSDENTVLHHRTYERVGREELTDLIPLCRECHGIVHTLFRRGEIASYDAPDINALVDQERARRNRRERFKVVQEQRQEFGRHSQWAYRASRNEVKSLVRQVGRVMHSAVSHNVDSSWANEEIRETLRALEQEIAARKSQQGKAA